MSFIYLYNKHTCYHYFTAVFIWSINPTQVRDCEYQPGDGWGTEAQQGGDAHVGAGHRQGEGEDDRRFRVEGAEEQVQQVQRFHRNAGC